jgi:DNA-binding NarL/FixJ family response regulator
MTRPRAHRGALPADEAAATLAAEASRGLLDADVVAAVLTEAGHVVGRTAPVRPAGLSEREVEVLTLIAHGMSNAQVAEQLYISRRTAEHHAQHIYAKIGVSTRAAAALFAVHHDLVRPNP